MDKTLPDRLDQASQYIASNRLLDAQNILVGVVMENPGCEQGWELLSQTVSEPYQQAECLQHVLRINPNNAAARSRLSKIQSKPGVQKQHLEPGEHVLPFINPDQPEWQVTPALIEAEAEQTQTLETARAGKRRAWVIPVLVLLALAVLAGTVVAALTLAAARPQPTAAAAVSTLTTLITTPEDLRTLPPTWTPVLTVTPGIRTATPLPTPVTVAAPLPLDQASAAEVASIIAQVARLRGLPAPVGVSAYLVTRQQAHQLTAAQVLDSDALASLAQEKLLLQALGLFKPEQDIVTLTMDSLLGGDNAIFLPGENAIYVVGDSLQAYERVAFAHETGLALAEEKFAHLAQLQDPGDCNEARDACLALSAVAEGDAALLAETWAARHASLRDRQTLIDFPPQPDVDPALPAYALPAAGYAAEFGEPFVRIAFEQGGWQAVNKLYEQPPVSSEQVLHPEKYLDAEIPLEIPFAVLSPNMGGEWNLVESSVLGEWMTRQMLASAAESGERARATTARRAAAGWGGDRYQLYARDGDGALALSVLWQWDTVNDQAEFFYALAQQMDARYGARQAQGPDQLCWSVETQSGCLYAKEQRALWLLAPDMDTIRALAEAFPEIVQ